MPKNDLYSIRMRASSRGNHVSGAERIVDYPKVKTVVDDLLERSFTNCQYPDQITIKIESLQDLRVLKLVPLDVFTVRVPSMQAGRDSAGRMLVHMGVSREAALLAIDLLSRGPAPDGKNMRGALIMDADTGERLEPDHERGIRASRFDWAENAFHHSKDRLAKAGLMHNRTQEALALATKIANAPGVVAELCWSDDPDYIAGYVASLRSGYIRFPALKENGINKGGRVIFVDRASLDLDRLVMYLQNEPVLISEIDHAPKDIAADANIETMFRQ